MLREAYRAVLAELEKIPQRMEREKTRLAEAAAIRRKRPLWRTVTWTAQQQAEFDGYWKAAWGRRISSRWHRLYQAINGVFRPDYFPEALYSTVVAPALNDWRYARTLEDKSLIEPLFADSGVTIPETICLCSGGVLVDGQRRPITRERAGELVCRVEEAVFKPTVGSSSGRGVQFFQDGREAWKAVELAMSQGQRDFILQRRIVSHSDWARFHPRSVNTLRVTTFLAEGRIAFGPVAFRIGQGEREVDNSHAGGIGVGVREDGTLMDTGYELGWGDKVIRYQRHPDSGIPFAGVVLPGVPAVLEAAGQLHGRLSHIGVASWDFTADPAGRPVLIELNLRGQGVWFPQIVCGEGLFGAHTETVLRQVRANRRGRR